MVGRLSLSRLDLVHCGRRLIRVVIYTHIFFVLVVIIIIGNNFRLDLKAVGVQGIVNL